ncbi:MAG: (d)CMP kinase [Candidatus Eisenbacteria bacterium]|nr:(d)CMP kinase [Candidatus Eisenbacteria bacterium]
MRRGIIAIDGPASSGKSTTAKEVARRLGYRFFDTGAMYRALALRCLRSGADAKDGKAVEAALKEVSVRIEDTAGGNDRILLDGEDVTDEIRAPSVGNASSEIAGFLPVRRLLVKLQRNLGKDGGVVMEGRDIATVVFPDAELKVFLDASVGERARRRFLELGRNGHGPSLERVTKELSERDRRDMTRKESPLQKAPGAVTIDTTGMTFEEQVEAILREARKVIPGIS